MTAPTDPRGCAGSWRLFDNWSGYPQFSGLDVFQGFELDDPQWQRTPGSSVAWRLVATGTDNRVMFSTGGINDPNSILFFSSREFVKTDPNCQTVTKYDCINGACIPKSTYSTPGIYNSLSECETACGTGCSGKCISNADWAQIEGLSNQLKNRNCS
jgi:hypothetical protein